MRRATRWERSAQSLTEDFGPECIVWDSGTATLHHLDVSGTLVWRCLEAPSTADEVATRVVDRLGTDLPDEAAVRQDVHDFLAELGRKSLTVKGR